MLIEFTVGNYRSFKDPQTLSMVATGAVAKDKRLDTDNVFETDGVRLLKSAALYGANSSGKSNFIKAISFARRFVTRFRAGLESDVNEPIRVEPFLLDAATAKQPSFFEAIFFARDRQYRYGFKATQERVLSEWLYHVPEKRESMLFTRNNSEYAFQGAFKEEGAGLENRTRENRLFLSVVAEFNGSIARTVLDWFSNLRINSGLSAPNRFLTERMLDTNHASPELRAKVLELLRGLQLDFDDVIVERQPSGVPGAVVDNPRLPVDSNDDESLQQPARRAFLDGRMLTRTIHHMNDSNEVVHFELDRQESDGTQRVYALAGQLVDVLARGSVMIVDEMDARLHPILTRNMVQLFNTRETNPKNAQLIYTTHDTNLLTNRLFRRDQVWFVEKDQQQASKLYSLVEFKGVRNDASFEKDYILGRYGAIPFLGNLRDVLSPPDNDKPQVEGVSISAKGEQGDHAET